MTKQLLIVATPQFETKLPNNDPIRAIDSSCIIVAENFFLDMKWHSELAVYATTFGKNDNVRYCLSRRNGDNKRPSHGYYIDDLVAEGHKSVRVEITIRFSKPFSIIEYWLPVLIECGQGWISNDEGQKFDVQQSQRITTHSHDNLEWKGEFVIEVMGDYDEKGIGNDHAGTPANEADELQHQATITSTTSTHDDVFPTTSTFAMNKVHSDRLQASEHPLPHSQNTLDGAVQCLWEENARRSHFETYHPGWPNKCRWQGCHRSIKLFDQSSQTKDHVLRHVKIYACNICGNTYGTSSNLKDHKRVHSSMEYKCDVCGNQFARKAQLKVHKRKHLRVKPYECDKCGYTCTTQGYLNVHIRRHSGLKPYECELCSKRFADRCGLNQHKLIHSGEKPYTCEICEKAFNSRSNLKKHRRVHS